MEYCREINQYYPFKLPELPFKESDFEPDFSAETFRYHHGKHQLSYVNNLNKLLPKDYYGTLEHIIITQNQDKAVFNNALQIWNHSFFWNSITPHPKNISENLSNYINKSFDSIERFYDMFLSMALTHFGSGWIWLIYKKNDKFDIITTSNADSPVSEHICPLLVCDLWEHAYYIDYRNNRKDFVINFLKYINWEFVEKQLILSRENLSYSN